MVLRRGLMAPTSFTLDVQVDGSGNLTSASVGGDSSLFTVSGTRIIGVEGTAYEGFTFVYRRRYVRVDQRDAELRPCRPPLQCVANGASDTSTGSIQTVIDNLNEKNSDYESDISDIEEPGRRPARHG